MSNGGGERGAARYARAIERRWSVRLDRPVVLSPRDWGLIADWHARGIPLPLVLEAIDAAFEPKRGGVPRRPPKGLAYVAPAVEEAWRVTLDGRLAPGAETPPAAMAAVEAWKLRCAAEPPESTLRRLLERLLARLARGDRPAEVEAELERELGAAVAPARCEAAEAATDRELQPFRERIDGATLERTRRRAVMQRLRRELGLPVLGEGDEAGGGCCW